MTPDRGATGLDRGRYRRVLRFLLGVLLRALWWEVVLQRPLLRRLRTPPLPRWAAVARRFRDLAVAEGGVLIKLGQFLSARVDVLPDAVTAELAALQDEVPPAPFPEVSAAIARDLGRPLDSLFSEIDPEPVGAASLAQVHRARLADGTPVVIKALRPGIERLVETDLAALRRAVRWLGLSRAIRRRVDVAWLEREFRTVTRRELDLAAEGRSTERFAADFADEPDVIVPRIHWSHSATRTLTLSDVGAIKVSDREGLLAAGINPGEVAKRLYAIYMRQFFVTHFVHADPHPGNIFVHRMPLPGPAPEATDPPPSGRTFRIAFVDFGMTTVIPERLRAALREFAIGLATRDARRMVSSYVQAGTLLEDANLERLVEAHEELLERFWGTGIGRMREVAMAEAQELARNYRDLLLAAPIQVQADMLFAMRAVGLLAGLCTRLDPDFDPWQATVPFADRFAGEAARVRIRERLEEAVELFARLLRVPDQLDGLLARADRGVLGVRARFSDDAGRRLGRIEGALARLTWTVASAALLVTAAVLRSAGEGGRLPLWLAVAAGLSAVAAFMPRRGTFRSGS